MYNNKIHHINKNDLSNHVFDADIATGSRPLVITISGLSPVGLKKLLLSDILEEKTRILHGNPPTKSKNY